MKGRESDLRFANLQISDYRNHPPPPISFSPVINLPTQRGSGDHFSELAKLLASNKAQTDLSNKQLAERVISLANRSALDAQYDIERRKQMDAFDYGKGLRL
jgi:hypothetical protein